MSREKRACEMAADIVRMSGNTVKYEDALEKTRIFFRNRPFWFGWFSHVNDDYVASDICRKLMTGK